MGSTDALQRKRLRFLLNMFLVVLGGLVILRMGYWMIIKADWLTAKASVQWIRELPIEPQRGNIEDRNGNILAASVTSNTVVLHPKSIQEDELDELVTALHEILGIDEETIREKATKTDYSVVWLKRQITEEQSELINELDSGGVSLTEDKKRYYPLGNFLTQVLGFTSVDGEGLEGIESRFDDILCGTPGSIVTETDRDGEPLPGSAEEYTDPIEGNNLVLTIDLAIQSYAEEAMEQCIVDTGAESATCIVMDCNTGEVLAMVNKPDFDNNDPPRDDTELLRELTTNTCIAEEYEPGSIFGLVTVAAALDSGSIDSGYVFDCEESLTTDSGTLYNWNSYLSGDLYLSDIFKYGCNLAFADISINMGLNTLYEYIYNLGFGAESGIKLYGESEGEITSAKYVDEYELGKIGYGQEIKVTSLQMAAAMCALVNGGNLVTPYIVKEVTSPDGEVLESYSSEITKSVISYETSSEIRDLMWQTVESGNGVYSYLSGYEIGGYAGTAQKYDTDGTIIEDSYVATFVAAAPIDDPEIVIFITVDNPETDASYGEVSAAPYAKMILEEALPYLSIMPEDESENTTEMPDVTGLSADEAEDELDDMGFDVVIMGYSGDVIGQVPAAGEEVENNSTVIILLEQEDDQNENIKVEVPDLIGLGSVEAYELLLEYGLDIKIVEKGMTVMEQYPEAGETAYAGDVITVTFGGTPVYESEDEDEDGDDDET